MTTTTITLIPMSGAASGLPIKVAATATPGTLIHTAQASTSTGCLDVPELQVYNSDTVDRTITFECWGVTAPDNLVKRTVPTGETISVPLPGGQNTLVLRAFGSAANVLVVSGAPGVKRVVVA